MKVDLIFKNITLSLLIFAGLSVSAYATPIFAVNSDSSVLHINPDKTISNLVVKATNISGSKLDNISIPYSSYKIENATATVTNTTCSGTLENGQSCLITFNILPISVGSAVLRPGVCAFNQSICSSGKIKVVVDHTAQSPIVGAIANTLPINTQVGQSYPLAAVFTNTDMNYPATNVNTILSLPESVITNNTCSGSLKPLASCEIAFIFTPTKTQTYALSGSVLYDQGPNVKATLSSAASQVEVTGKVLSPLPEHIEKDRSYPVTFQFTNYGSADASGVNFTQPSGLTITSNTCANLPSQILASKRSCTIQGTFQGSTTGPVSLSSTFTSPQQANPVTLTTSSEISDVIVQANINPQLPANISTDTAYPVTFTFTNSGSLPATDLKITKLFPYFSETSDTCTTELEPGASCAVSGTYQTPVEGPGAISLILHYAEENTPITLTTSTTATKAAIVGSFTTPLPANVEENISYPVVFHYQNIGSANATNLSFVDSLPGFTADVPGADTCGATLDAGKGCKISGVFKASLIPQSSGPVSLSKTLTYNESPQPVSLVANATVTDAAISGSVAGLPNNVKLNTDYNVTFTFTNNGNANATGIKIIKYLPHVSAITDNCTSTLTPNSSCTITGTFNSAYEGPQTLSVDLLYNEGAHMLDSLATYVGYNHNITYFSIATGGATKWGTTSPQGWNQWVAPNGKVCDGSDYSKSCLYLPIDKQTLMDDLGMSSDSELQQLIDHKFYTPNSSPVKPWTVKDISFSGSDVILYGGDRDYLSYGYSSSTGVNIYAIGFNP